MSQKDIDRYLLNEMSEAEREEFENEFVADDELFAEVADRENDLVDRYVRNEISDEDLAKFERSLETLPARRQKVANARMLRAFISDERPVAKTITIAERKSFFSQLFSFGTPAFQFASIGVVAILAAASILLLVENRRLSSLEGELAAARTREAELSSLVESQTGTAAELTRDLDAERERIAKLEEDLAKAQGGAVKPPPVAPVRPTIAALILSPFGVRGGPDKALDLPSGVKQVSVVINLTDEVGDRVSVKLNQAEIAKSVKVQNKGGSKSVSLTVASQSLRDGANNFVVSDAEGHTTEYGFTVRKVDPRER